MRAWARQRDAVCVCAHDCVCDGGRHVLAHNNLGIAIGSQGDLGRALAQSEEALRLSPGFEDAAKNLEVARRARRAQ